MRPTIVIIGFAIASLAITSTAWAQPSATTITASAPDVATTGPVDHKYAVAVNLPLGWIGANSLAVSGYVALTRHQVVHANVASWTNAWSYGIPDNLALAAGGETGVETGRVTDVGVAWMYFPRRAFDGFSIEVGSFLRHRNTSYEGGEEDDPVETLHTTLVSGRAVAGWSWLIHDRAFISVQAGMSVGYERGSERLDDTDLMPMPEVTSSVSHVTVLGEVFVRMGVVFGS